MSTSLSGRLTLPTTVAIAATETVVVSYQREVLKGASRVTVQVVNLDAAQTFAGAVYRRQVGMTTWALSDFADFATIAPLGSVMSDMDVEGTDELEVRGTMSGAGANVMVAATRKAATP